MFTFTPTHEITLLLEDGTCVDIEVQLVRGAAFTHAEWVEGRDASWQLGCGRWSWCGRPLPPGCESATFQSAADAAFRRLAWELVDARINLEQERLVLARDSESEPSLWLEVSADRLRLVDEESANALPSSTSARQLRALVSEWRACRPTSASLAPPR
jgi:hypothetical protein